MGGNSTSHDVVLRGKKTQKSADFDLQSWQGLTEVLKRAKIALSNPAEYSSFRNLVLQYAQQGGDIETKKKIFSIVESFSETEAMHIEEQKSIQSENINGDALTEKLSSISNSEKATDQTPPHILENNHSGSRRLLPRFIKPTHSGQQNGAPAILPEERIERGEPVLPVQNSSTNTEIERATVSQITVPVSPENVSNTTLPNTPGTRTPSEYRSRIAEIKNLVHAAYGNPATLMNLRNGIGQRYMKTLLLAMKSLTPGSDENEDVRMADLETAYTELMSDSKENESSNFSKESNESTIIEEPVVVNEKFEHDVDEPEIFQAEDAPALETEPNEQEKSPEQADEEPVVMIPHEAKISPLKDTLIENTDSEVLPTIGYSNGSTLDDLSSRTARIRNTDFKSTITQKNNQSTYSDIVPQSIQQNKYPSQNFSSPFAPQKQVHAIPSQKEITVKQSELISEEISVALQSLLHDWTIFEGSGLFGIGPGGTEHPLYKKLASLSMNEVLAGRWEKSNPKIIKIIKEYVDAWRHEQGIDYSTNETFEHYLRRVIQKILKRKSTNQ